MNIEVSRLNRHCPICGSEAAHDHVDTWNDWHLKICAHCGFVYLQDPPGYQGLSHDFAWEKTYEIERARRREEEPVIDRLSWLMRRFRRFILKRKKLYDLVDQYIPSGRMLDVGCGGGGQMKRWFGGRYEPWGVEISNALAQKAETLFSKYGGHCVNSDAISGLNSLPAGHFDGVIMKSYLEHEVEPRAVCEAVRHCLKPGGHVVIKVPNYASWNRRFRGTSWCGYRFPDHVNYFTPKSLVSLVQDSGLDVVRFRWQDRIPTSDNMWIVAQRSS